MKVRLLGLLSFVALLGACDYNAPEPYEQAPAPVPVAPGSTAEHLNPQHGFAAPGATGVFPGGGPSNPGADFTGGGQGPGPVNPMCALIPAPDACTECLKGDCCELLLKCTADKSCSCLLKCVTTKPDDLLNCGISNGCGLPDMSFLSELQTCSKGCVEAKKCQLPSGIPGLGGGGQPDSTGGLPDLGGLGGLLGSLGSSTQG